MGIIEEAGKNDLQEILNLQKKAFESVAIKENNMNIQPMTQTYEEIVEEFGRLKFLKYTFDGSIIGSVRAHADENNICHVGKLIVHPDFQNRGIGKALMAEIHRMFDYCRGYELFTSRKSENTLYLYKKLGYVEMYVKDVGNVSMVFMRKDNQQQH